MQAQLFQSQTNSKSKTEVNSERDCSDSLLAEDNVKSISIYISTKRAMSQAPVFRVGNSEFQESLNHALSLNHHFKWVAAHLV